MLLNRGIIVMQFDFAIVCYIYFLVKTCLGDCKRGYRFLREFDDVKLMARAGDTFFSYFRNFFEGLNR